MTKKALALFRSKGALMLLGAALLAWLVLAWPERDRNPPELPKTPSFSWDR